MIDIDSAEAIIHGETFTQLNCSGKQITGKEFDHCHFDACDFSDASFQQCEFTDCSFSHCNLNLLTVNNSKFMDIRFSDCKALAIDWSKAYWRGFTPGSPFTFQRCLLNSSSFYGLNQSRIVMEECRAHDVDFREADLSGASLTGTDLTNSLFGNTNLTAADFTDAINYDINLNNNTLKNARFSRHEAVRLLEYLGVQLVD